MTKSDKKGMRGARLTILSSARMLKKVELGGVKGSDAEKAVAAAKLLLKEALSTLDEVELPKEVVQEAKAEVKAKVAKKEESVLDRVMPRKKSAVGTKKVNPPKARKSRKKAATSA